jgi:hypothetical protein
LLTVGLIGVEGGKTISVNRRHYSRLIVLLLDRRGKKRRGSMEWQAKQEKQKKAG